MIGEIKNFLLSREPFKPTHMGMWIRAFYFKHYLKREVDSQRLRKALDAGCGRGFYTNYLADLYPKCAVVGYDLKEFSDWKNYSRPNLSFKRTDLNLLQESGIYDLIISIDSLEHIPNNKSILEKFYLALTPGGYLYLHVPCEATEKYIFPRKFFKACDEWAKEEHIGEQHPLGELKEILSGLGFKILLARHTFTFWGHLAWEIETILRLKNKKWADRMNIVLMPLFKTLALFDLFFPLGGGDNLLIAKRGN